MSNQLDEFLETIKSGYTFDGETMILGASMYNKDDEPTWIDRWCHGYRQN